MNLFKSFVLTLMIFSFISDLNAGSIKGTVTFDGKPPKKKPLRMDADPVCGSAHKEKVFAESFKVNEKGQLEESLVYLRNVKYSGKVPSVAVELDQKGCVYKPHVFGIQAGQELVIKNSDATLHNIHSMPKKNKEFNFAMPKVVKKKTAKFESAEDPFYIKCDVHPWMKTWVLVSEHPYFAVTDSDGSYEIKNVPAGTYEVVCWQEKFKKKPIIRTITVGEGATNENFIFIKKPKKK